MLALEIKAPNEGIFIHQIKIGLLVGHFLLSLAKKSLAFLVSLLTQSKKYINAKEVEMARWKFDQSQSNKLFLKDKPCNCPTFALRAKYHNYEPLKVKIDKITKDI